MWRKRWDLICATTVLPFYSWVYKLKLSWLMLGMSCATVWVTAICSLIVSYAIVVIESRSPEAEWSNSFWLVLCNRTVYANSISTQRWFSYFLVSHESDIWWEKACHYTSWSKSSNIIKNWVIVVIVAPKIIFLGWPSLVFLVDSYLFVKFPSSAVMLKHSAGNKSQAKLSRWFADYSCLGRCVRPL